MRDLSGLGSTTVLTLFTVTTVGYLALVSARTMALLVAASVISGSVVVSVFKAAFGRLRPDAAYAELVASGLSFPSGHATMAAIVFLTLGALIAGTRSRLKERIAPSPSRARAAWLFASECEARCSRPLPGGLASLSLLPLCGQG